MTGDTGPALTAYFTPLTMTGNILFNLTPIPGCLFSPKLFSAAAAGICGSFPPLRSRLLSQPATETKGSG